MTAKNDTENSKDSSAVSVESTALFDSLKSERDQLILDLWNVFRRMSEVKPAYSLKLDDLELWTKVTEHRAIQNRLSNIPIERNSVAHT